MRIETVEAFRISQRFALVRIATDTGSVGWGEVTLESRSATSVAAVGELAGLLVGEDPRAIVRLGERLRRGGFYRGGPVFGSAVAGIDQALWDLKGRALGVPVHELLGGPARDRVRIYTSVSSSGSVAETVASAVELVAAGYTALKTAPEAVLGFLDPPAAHDALLDRWSALRDAVGRSVDLAFDLHGRFSLPAARRFLPRMEGLDPLFVEEPTPPEHQRDLARVCASTRIPIATGERLHDRWEVAGVIGTGIAVLQPDLSHAYGITEVHAIAAVAAAHGVQLAPHCATGPVAFAACLQLDLAVPNVLIQECPLALHRAAEHPLARFVVGSPFVVGDGYVLPPTGPGLGIEIDEDAVRAAAADPQGGDSPIWRLADGSYAEW